MARAHDRTAAIFQGAYDAAVAIWGSLPGAIGDFAFQAANELISGVEAMLHGVVTRINSFIETLNAALALLTEWATGEGGVRIGILDPVELGRIVNPFEGAATAAGAAAGAAVADAFSAALSRTYLEPPDLGLGVMADDARARADGYREAAGMLADAAGRPLASWQVLNDAVTGTGTEAETALADATGAADSLTAGLYDTATAADGAGGAARDAGAAAAQGVDTALTGWQAVSAALADYAAKARDIGGDIGSALVGAFQSAENAIGDFVKTGKLDFRDLVTSMIADLAKLAARPFILGPIASALSGALGGRVGSSPTSCMRAARSAPSVRAEWSLHWPLQALRARKTGAGPGCDPTRCPRSCNGANGFSPGARRQGTVRRAGPPSMSRSTRATPRASGNPGRR